MTPRLYLFGGIGLAFLLLLAALLSTRATLADTRHDLSLAEAKLSVSNSSIATLQAELKRALIEQQGLATNDAQRAQASREAMKLAEAASEYRKAAIERLQASAGILRPTPAADCQVSDAVSAAWPQ